MAYHCPLLVIPHSIEIGYVCMSVGLKDQEILFLLGGRYCIGTRHTDIQMVLLNVEGTRDKQSLFKQPTITYSMLL